MAILNQDIIENRSLLCDRHLIKREQNRIRNTASVIHIDDEWAEVLPHYDIPEDKIMDLSAAATPRLDSYAPVRTIEYAIRNDKIGDLCCCLGSDYSSAMRSLYSTTPYLDSLCRHVIGNTIRARSRLQSNTIITDESVDGDGLSTTCFALGLKDGMALIESLEDTEAIFITDDYELHASSGIGSRIPCDVY